MEIRNLKLFKHLAESLHFGRTSRACNVTPSALTRIIQRMEDELGSTLFIRDNRSVELSPTGQVFKNFAEDSISRWDELQNELSRETMLSGEISLYCSVTAAYTILPRILGRFRKVYPDLHLNLQTGDAAQAITKLENNEVDIIIAALPDRVPERLIYMDMLTTPLVFIGPRHYPEIVTRQGDEIDWHQTPVIMAELGLSRERIERWFRQKQITPHIYAQVGGNEALIAMVSLGYGVGVVPSLVLEKSPMQDQITILDVSPALQSFTIGLCTMKKKMAHPKIEAFWELAQQERTP
ncbi:MAG: HTH-type transcriptional activator IlvY [Desulfobulbaceae bacterium]|jgi:LysR family positive regulator for ilvC|nr:HTH-type transcriptional activator IlvY [Desulfobulbaceae bacterium]